jgi:hypothetical protein
MMLRREEELVIAKAFLSEEPGIVAEFRMDLPQLWAIFNRYDKRVQDYKPGQECQSTVLNEDLLGLLIDVGICPSKQKMGSEKGLAAVREHLGPWAKKEIYFPQFLKIMRDLRKKCKAAVLDELLDRFHCYDRKKLGELHYSQVYQILADFKMLPRSPEEQHGIVLVIERLDNDGSGTFNFEEFQDFFQRLTEQVQMTEREAERQMVLAMGFSEHQLHTLRMSYAQLKPNEVTGKILQIGLVSAVQKTREILCPNGADEQNVRDITKTAQLAPEKGINFQEFAQALKGMFPKQDEDDG